jgi:hypothetical protein
MYYADSKDEFTNIQTSIKKILSNNIPPEQIVILVPYKQSVDSLRNLALPVPAVELQTASQRIGTIGVATIASFKGLERDCVILADLDNLDKADLSQLLYVGASRPRVLLNIHAKETNRGWFATQAQHFGQRLAGSTSS